MVHLICGRGEVGLQCMCLRFSEPPSQEIFHTAAALSLLRLRMRHFTRHRLAAQGSRAARSTGIGGRAPRLDWNPGQSTEWSTAQVWFWERARRRCWRYNVHTDRPLHNNGRCCAKSLQKFDARLVRRLLLWPTVNGVLLWLMSISFGNDPSESRRMRLCEPIFDVWESRFVARCHAVHLMRATLSTVVSLTWMRASANCRTSSQKSRPGTRL